MTKKKSLDEFAKAKAVLDQVEITRKVRAMLSKRPMSVNELVEALHLGLGDGYGSMSGPIVGALLEIKRGHGILTETSDHRFHLAFDVLPGGTHSQFLQDRGDGWTVMGFTSDNHLCSPHTRLDVLNKLYDIFAAEGVTDVYNGGNWIEGEARFNRHDVSVVGMTPQIDFMVQNYPSRPGITTHYVAGDDHEGWYQQRERVLIGQYLEAQAKNSGRHDLHYLGYVEADIALVAPGAAKASVPMKVMHGGGGNAYALSYTLQKLVESLQPGEKPAVICLGHHHKFAYVYPRSVHAFMPGCTEDQSIFMRKNKIEAHVGGVLVRLKQDPEHGYITQFECRWMPFYDRKFYQNHSY